MKTRGYAAAAALLVALTGCGSTVDVAGPSTEELQKSAISKCEDAVKDQLKSPSTATFSDMKAGDLRAMASAAGLTPTATPTITGSKPWTVTGKVDSENSFGAMLRSTVFCMMDLTDGTFSNVKAIVA